MELRFIAFFEGAGVKLRVIRSIMDDVRTELRSPHPFATNIIFKTDGAKIVAEIANKSGASNLYDLRSKNFEMKTVIYKSLKDGVIFDPKGDARAWFPRRDIAPNVIVHPRLAFGRPVIKRYGIPTETLASAVKVEGSVEMVAELYEVSEGSVREAVSFEQNIRRAA
jgi:uncharacterized protein (DUF433 family)